MKKLILASQSPRRKEILRSAGYIFDIHPPKLSEMLNKNLSLDDALKDLARQKAQACWEQFRDVLPDESLILASDTMVICDDRELGKPRNRQEAYDFVKLLSGRMHYVKTAISFIDLKTRKSVEAISTAKVWFKDLDEAEINNYVDSDEPYDKAGGYGIQAKAGEFVEKLEGDLQTVIGLPLSLVEEILKKEGWNVIKG